MMKVPEASKHKIGYPQPVVHDCFHLIFTISLSSFLKVSKEEHKIVVMIEEYSKNEPKRN